MAGCAREPVETEVTRMFGESDSSRAVRSTSLRVDNSIAARVRWSGRFRNARIAPPESPGSPIAGDDRPPDRRRIPTRASHGHDEANVEPLDVCTVVGSSTSTSAAVSAGKRAAYIRANSAPASCPARMMGPFSLARSSNTRSSSGTREGMYSGHLQPRSSRARRDRSCTRASSWRSRVESIPTPPTCFRRPLRGGPLASPGPCRRCATDGRRHRQVRPDARNGDARGRWRRPDTLHLPARRRRGVRRRLWSSIADGKRAGSRISLQPRTSTRAV